ncbi:MAG: MarR family transcriptional regulator [Pirellulaceae bacterium]
MSLPVASDEQILDLLRVHRSLTVSDFSRELGVTATAVRQRLTRLLGQGFVERIQLAADGRGRPSHQYRLTEAGHRESGSHFPELAKALWEELRSIQDADIRRGLLARISARISESYRDRFAEKSTKERIATLAQVFREKGIPFQVESTESNELPVLTALACPYPGLAETDRSVCAMEKMMISELAGTKLVLSECRLDGDNCCRFEPESVRIDDEKTP